MEDELNVVFGVVLVVMEEEEEEQEEKLNVV